VIMNYQKLPKIFCTRKEIQKTDGASFPLIIPQYNRLGHGK
jgi:hypothetical protein